MRCPQCLQQIQESIKQCQCGFAFDDVAKNIFVGNVWNWIPPHSFNYVRTELDYVPRNYRKTFIKRLLTEFVAPNGRLIVSQYRSRHDDLTQGWIDKEIEMYGFSIVEVHSGYSKLGLELCRVGILSS